MPASSETLPVLEQRLAERLLAFERLDAAGPRGRTAIERAEIGRHREGALSGVVALRGRIVTARAETLADAAVQLRRLVVMANRDGHLPNGRLLAPDFSLTWSLVHRAAHPRPPNRDKRPRFRPMLDRATVLGGWEESSGKFRIRGRLRYPDNGKATRKDPRRPRT